MDLLASYDDDNTEDNSSPGPSKSTEEASMLENEWLSFEQMIAPGGVTGNHIPSATNDFLVNGDVTYPVKKTSLSKPSTELLNEINSDHSESEDDDQDGVPSPSMPGLTVEGDDDAFFLLRKQVKEQDHSSSSEGSGSSGDSSASSSRSGSPSPPHLSPVTSVKSHASELPPDITEPSLATDLPKQITAEDIKESTTTERRSSHRSHSKERRRSKDGKRSHRSKHHTSSKSRHRSRSRDRRRPPRDRHRRRHRKSRDGKGEAKDSAHTERKDSKSETKVEKDGEIKVDKSERKNSENHEKHRRSKSRDRKEHKKDQKRSRSRHRDKSRERKRSKDRKPSKSRDRSNSRDRKKRHRSKERRSHSRHRSRDRSRERLRSRSPPGRKLTFKEQMRKEFINASKEMQAKEKEEGAMLPLKRPGECLKPSDLLKGVNLNSGESVTPQMALMQTMAAMHKKAQELTGVEVPKYYNPAAVNPLKYAEQIKKRKLLWSKKGEEKEKNEQIETQWKSAFMTTEDKETASKFRKLMGIKGEGDESEEMSENIQKMSEEQHRKQTELFDRLDQEYNFARIATHTQRGVGFGFATSVIDPNHPSHPP